MKSAALWTIPLCAMVALPMNAQNNTQNNKGKQREKQEVVAKSGEGSDTNLGKANNMMMNASEESEPRFINVGLPALPNGLPDILPKLLVPMFIWALKFFVP